MRSPRYSVNPLTTEEISTFVVRAKLLGAPLDENSYLLPLSKERTQQALTYLTSVGIISKTGEVSDLGKKLAEYSLEMLYSLFLNECESSALDLAALVVASLKTPSQLLLHHS